MNAPSTDALLVMRDSSHHARPWNQKREFEFLTGLGTEAGILASAYQVIPVARGKAWAVVVLITTTGFQLWCSSPQLVFRDGVNRMSTRNTGLPRRVGVWRAKVLA